MAEPVTIIPPPPPPARGGPGARVPSLARDMCVLALVLASIAAWRLGPAWLGYLLSGFTLVAAVGISISRGQHSPRLAIWLALVCGGVAALGLLAHGQTAAGLDLPVAQRPAPIWPCQTCAAGADWQTLFGGDLLWWAVGGYACWLLLALHDAALLRWQVTYFVSDGIAWETPIARGQARELAWWLLAGGVLYYLHVSLSLGLTCSLCFSLHTALLAGIASVPGSAWLGSGDRLLRRMVLLALGYAAVVMSHQLDRQHQVPIAASGSEVPVIGNDTTAAVLSLADQEVYLAAAQGRRVGKADAPWVIELGLSMTCSHCAEAYPTLMASLDADIQAGRVQVVLRQGASSRSPAIRQMSRLAVAAAAMGKQQAFLDWALGSNAGDVQGMLRRVGRAVDVDVLQRIEAEHAPALDRLLREDEVVAQPAKLHAPWAVIHRRGESNAAQTWSDLSDARLPAAWLAAQQPAAAPSAKP